MKQEEALFGLGPQSMLGGLPGWHPEPATPQAPVLPRIVNLHDRQVYIGSEDASLYSLCRKWVQNFPIVDTPVPEPQSIQLPPLPKPEQPQQEAEPPPTYSDNYTPQNYEPEDVLRLMKSHWISVREHFQQQSAQRMQRQQARVIPWLQAATLPTGAGLPMGFTMQQAGLQQGGVLPEHR